MSSATWVRSIVAFVLGAACTSVLASDMPSMPDSTWKAVLIVSCLPALIVVPAFLLRAVYFRLVAPRTSEASPTTERWWLWVTLASLLPWAILVPWILVDMASRST